MKKVHIAFCLILFALLVVPQAIAVQLAPGTIMISGDSSFGFSSEKREAGNVEETITSFGLMVKGGYFVIDNVEALVMFEFDRTSTENSTESTSTLFGLGFGGNYYFDLSTDMFPYGGAFLGYANEKIENGYDTEIKGFRFGLQGGAKYFLNDNFAADAGLRLTFGKGYYESGGYSEDADSFEFELFAGVAVIL